MDMSVEQEILETGIKVVDMLAPYCKGGKIGRFTVVSFRLKCVLATRDVCKRPGHLVIYTTGISIQFPIQWYHILLCTMRMALSPSR